jgi:hypothetical protein
MSLILFLYRYKRCSQGCIVLLLCVGGWYLTFSEDSDRELLDKLYNDILGTVAGSQQKNLDTGFSRLNRSGTDSSSVNQVISPASLTIEADLRLKAKVDEMIKEAQQRHEETIKFMQETK